MNPDIEKDNLRLVLAAVAMHGLLTSPVPNTMQAIADAAVKQADALLAALEKKQ